MDKNEIKKALYKGKPVAYQKDIDDKTAVYSAKLSDGEVYFKIPLSDAQGANLQKEMPSQLLIRWINSFFPFEK